MEAEGNLSDDSPPEVGLPLPCSLDPLEETFDEINKDLTVDPPPLEYPATLDGPSAKTATKRAWVEEVDDDVPAAKKSATGRWAENFPRPAGTLKGHGLTSFQRYQNAQEANSDSPWALFKTKDDWELARWLTTSGVSQTKINEFLKLGMVRSLR